MVLIGTTYPLLLEAFTGTQVGVGEPFFNRLAVPLSFMLLLTMGFGPVTPWGGAPPGLLWRRLRWPTMIALALGLVVALTVTRVAWVTLAIVLGAFVAAAILGLLLELDPSKDSQIRAFALSGGEDRHRERSGVLGGPGQPYRCCPRGSRDRVRGQPPLHSEAELMRGESVEFAGYTLTYDAPFRRDEPNRVVQGARVEVSRDDRIITVLEPRANFYDTEMGGIVTPSVMSRPRGDLYLTLRSLDDETVRLGLDTSPMIWLLWLGGVTDGSRRLLVPDGETPGPDRRRTAGPGRCLSEPATFPLLPSSR